MLSFKLFTICQDERYPNRSVYDDLYICCFNITISWKRYVFYQNASVHVISFVVYVLKNIEFLVTLNEWVWL